LSSPSGRVDLSWSVTRTQQGLTLVLDWKESRGPAPRRTRRVGFGSRLINMVIERQLNGQVEQSSQLRDCIRGLPSPSPTRAGRVSHAQLCAPIRRSGAEPFSACARSRGERSGRRKTISDRFTCVDTTSCVRGRHGPMDDREQNCELSAQTATCGMPTWPYL